MTAAIDRKKKGSLATILSPDLIKQYAAQGMSFDEIALMLGYTKTRICQILEEKPELRSAWEAGHAELCKTLTSALMRCVEKDNIVAILFALKSRCGWIEEQYRKDKEISNQPTVTVYLPSNGRDDVQAEPD